MCVYVRAFVGVHVCVCVCVFKPLVGVPEVRGDSLLCLVSQWATPGLTSEKITLNPSWPTHVQAHTHTHTHTIGLLMYC